MSMLFKYELPFLELPFYWKTIFTAVSTLRTEEGIEQGLRKWLQSTVKCAPIRIRDPEVEEQTGYPWKDKYIKPILIVYRTKVFLSTELEMFI